MLQFVIRHNNEYTTLQQAQMAVKGGCTWIVFTTPDTAGDDEVAKEAAPVADFCRETGVILTVENHIEAAKQLGVHGILLTDKALNAVELRNRLGAEAIIGARVADVASAALLGKNDIDYVLLPDDWDLERVAQFVADLRGAGGRIPVVIYGNFTAANVAAAMATGVSGVAAGPALLTADPVKAVTELLEALNQ